MPEATTLTGLPVNLDDLINARSVESNRIEFKKTWDDNIKAAVIRTVSAFANDLLNLNGGYVILGVDESNGIPVLPAAGLGNLSLDLIQRELRGACRAAIRPEFQPVLFPVTHQEKWIIVIWAPAGDNRPYQAAENYGQKGTPFSYFVRQGSETVKAQGDILRQLIESAAKVPFDDRRNLEGRVEDLSSTLVRSFLRDVRSDLLTSSFSDLELYRRLRIVIPINAHDAPRNVGLLFFTQEPSKFFPGARIEVVQFGDGAGGDLIEERVFEGPLNEQISSTLNYLNSLGGALLQKVSGQAEVERTVAYPYEAMEEALVNAVYHRSYESPEPVKVYLYPDRMEIFSYPGPVPGVTQAQFEPGHNIPAVPARNRRIGELLKELRLAEGRGTGIPKIRRKMMENGSPQAQFRFDNERTYFQVILPVHPRYQVLHAIREAAHLWAVGEKKVAVDHLKRAFAKQSNSGALTAQLIDYYYLLDDADGASQVLEQFEKATDKSEAAQPYLATARQLLNRSRFKEASAVLQRIPAGRSAGDLVEAAVLRRRAGDYEGVHHLLSEAYSITPNDPKVVHELAQAKRKLAGIHRNSFRDGKTAPTRAEVNATCKKLHRDAEELLRKAISIGSDPLRIAWCWHDLAWNLYSLRAPDNEIEQAFLRARLLAPSELSIERGYQKWQTLRGGRRAGRGRR